ncbi:carbonic anhydrase 4-like [Colossoma macropomum]|uniref:carbonic anhydrase 4-like n=1 Tax=Colossoma macropomum TaxID=42526 RepID=UPI001863A84E|nr:carbonic anhydrase 4-like [Colossoma macropomum]
MHFIPIGNLAVLGAHSLDSQPRRNGLSMQRCKATVLSFLMLMLFKVSAFKVSTLNYCYKEDDCNPYMWAKSFSSCVPNETKLHSPIDLGDGAVKTDSVLELHGFGDPQASWTVANIRDTVVVEFDTGMTMSGDWLQYDYQLVEMRFHWGSKTTNGSEHTLNKRRFPMEMQIVGVAPGFVDVETASHQQSGLAMMGVFIDIGAEENVPFKAISDVVTKVPYPGDSVNVTPPALFKLMPGRDSKFYRYQGGQTTPPCLQNVEWIVFEKPILISEDQYLSFATHLYYSDKNSPEKKLLVENYRPIQSSSKHQIFVSTAVKIHSARGATQSQHAVFIPLIILYCLLQFIFKVA